jgi:hypothetical protein
MVFYWRALASAFASKKIMRKSIRATPPIYNLLPTEIEGFYSVAELALDICWSWNQGADEVRRRLDPTLWKFTQNPWVVLQTVSRGQLERMRESRALLTPRCDGGAILLEDARIIWQRS